MAENDVKLPDLSGVIDMISKNPDLVKNVANAFSAMSQSVQDTAPIDSQKEESVSVSSPAFDTSALNSLLPILTQTKPKGSTKAHHNELLCALKPYLSPERCAVIDRMLEFGQLGDILRAFEGKK